MISSKHPRPLPPLRRPADSAASKSRKRAPIQPPTVDQLAVRVLVDGSYNLFLRPGQIKNIKIEPAPRQTDFRRALHNQWGLSLLLDSKSGAEQHTVMLDFGYTAECAHQQHGDGRRRSEKDRGADRQPRPLRPLRRPARHARQISQRAARRPHALCRRRGQFLPALRRTARPAVRIRRARPARAGIAQGQDRAVRKARWSLATPSPRARSSAPASKRFCPTPPSNSR